MATCEKCDKSVEPQKLGSAPTGKITKAVLTDWRFWALAFGVYALANLYLYALDLQDYASPVAGGLVGLSIGVWMSRVKICPECTSVMGDSIPTGDDPWLSLTSRYFLSQVVKGTVVSRTDSGVLVEIEHGVEGLVHMSELAHEDDWETNYPDGKELTVAIRRVDAHDRKLSLSEEGAEGLEFGDGA